MTEEIGVNFAPVTAGQNLKFSDVPYRKHTICFSFRILPEQVADWCNKTFQPRESLLDHVRQPTVKKSKKPKKEEQNGTKVKG